VAPQFAGLELTPIDGGTRMRLRVHPGARGDRIVGAHGGALKVSVAAPPERGRANAAVVALLAHALSVPSSAIAIVAGETGRDKVVTVALEAGELARRLGDRPSGRGRA